MRRREFITLLGGVAGGRMAICHALASAGPTEGTGRPRSCESDAPWYDDLFGFVSQPQSCDDRRA